MYYYSWNGTTLASFRPREDLGPETEPGDSISVLLPGDPVLGRGSFRITHPGQLSCPHGLEVLDASRLPEPPEWDAALQRALESGTLTAICEDRSDWQRALPAKPAGIGGKRVHILAVGDVGSTILLGFKLLGAGTIDTIGICDLSEANCARWTTEMGQITKAWEYGTMPRVETVSLENLFACDVFLFVASKGIPPVGSKVQDVRMAQFEDNAGLVKIYARMARAAHYQGLWAAVSDPVDLLAKTAYLESNKDENGVWDGKGLRPEQVQGYGLGVMNARAAYYAEKDSRFASFLKEGRAFGPHGEGLVIANSVEQYDDALSRELTGLALRANLEVRELGYKPYVAPAISSAVLPILATMRGEWHYGSVFLDGIYMGCRNRYTRYGLETELLPRIPDPLWERISAARTHLKGIL